MANVDLKLLRQRLAQAKNGFERNSILDQTDTVVQVVAERPFLRRWLEELSIDCAALIKQLIVIGQVIDLNEERADRWREALEALLPVDLFYREMGGLVGYHVEVQRLLQKGNSCPEKRVYHAPVFDDISREEGSVVEAIAWGLEAVPEMAELYPLGGAADRLHLVDEATGMELPAAKLQFAGRTLLEGLIRDLQAREWLYFRLFGKQWTTPIGIMTSWEKQNHAHVQKLLSEHHWFGRPKNSIRCFVQPLVPAVDETGQWCVTAPFRPLLKPGGHGAIWKLARDEGILRWFRSLGRRKALVRQINNPIAGVDYGLLAFTGIGWQRNMRFGFASCPRLVQAAEGMNVLVESERGELTLTNVEYCDFSKYGIEDKPLREGDPYSRFSSNTNILFVDLAEVERAIETCPLPGLLINMKKGMLPTSGGATKEIVFGRLESTMQNLADFFVEPKQKEWPLRTRQTFVTYNQREKTISVAKKAYVPGKSTLETTERCFYELLQTNRQLLAECGFLLSPSRSESEMLASGPDCLFLYHPALGPLYSILRQKLRRGALAIGSEWLLEIAEADLEEVHIDGSLRVYAENPIGFTDQEGVLHYSSHGGRCQLRNVSVYNRGVDWTRAAPFWKMAYTPLETVEIVLQGNSEFVAEDLRLEGGHRFVVAAGTQMRVFQRGSTLCTEISPLEGALWDYSWEGGVKLTPIPRNNPMYQK